MIRGPCGIRIRLPVGDTAPDLSAGQIGREAIASNESISLRIVGLGGYFSLTAATSVSSKWTRVTSRLIKFLSWDELSSSA